MQVDSLERRLFTEVSDAVDAFSEDASLTGTWAVSTSGDTATLRVWVDAGVPMGFVDTLPLLAAHAAAGVLAGIDGRVQLLWPAKLVVPTQEKRAIFGACDSKVFYDGQIKAAIAFVFDTSVFGLTDKQLDELGAALCRACAEWASVCKAGVAGPLAPIVDSYYERCAGFGECVHVRDLGRPQEFEATLLGLDIWGRITLGAGGRELELTRAQVTIDLLD